MAASRWFRRCGRTSRRSATQYLIDGKPPEVGATIKNPALAKLLRKIADDGPDAFYTGKNAQAIVDAATGSKVAPSDMTLADLAAYRAKERPPVCGMYRTYKICGMGPPSSGATTVLGILGMLERFDMKKLGKDLPVAWHLIGEAMELAYADREKYLGDRDFVEVPVAGLIDPAYLQDALEADLADQHARQIRSRHAPRRAATHRRRAERSPRHDALRRDRRRRQYRQHDLDRRRTVRQPAARQRLRAQQRAHRLHARPRKGRQARRQPRRAGQAPAVSMSPTIVYDAKTNRPIFVVGAAGGKTIIMQVAKAIIARLDWGMEPRDALGLGLIYFNQDGVILEQGTSLEALKPAMEKLGNKVSIAKLGLKANAAAWDGSKWVGAADPRSVGVALEQ